MKTWRSTRFLSIVLVLAMFIQMLPMQTFAVDNANETTDTAALTTEEQPSVSIIGEVEELREENTKHFRLSDGSFVAVAYGLPVHYQDDAGEWQDIDNSFTMVADRADTAIYQSSNAASSLTFNASLEEGNLFTTSKGEFSVSMSLLDTSQAILMGAVEAELETSDITDPIDAVITEESTAELHASEATEVDPSEELFTENASVAELATETTEETESEEILIETESIAETAPAPTHETVISEAPTNETISEEISQVDDSEILPSTETVAESVTDSTEESETVPNETTLSETTPEETMPFESSSENEVPSDTVPENTIPQETIFEEIGEAEITDEAEIPSADENTASISEIGTYSRTATAQIAQDVSSLLNMQSEYDWDINDMIPQKLQSSLLYEDVFPGVDLLYTAYSHNIKEQIIVNAPQESYRYDFLLNMEGLTAVLNDDGSVSLRDAKETEIYQIPVPYMIDDAGEVSFDVAYTLCETDQGTVLTVAASEEWINDTDRAFPVKIDPTLIYKASSFKDDIYAAYPMEGEPNTLTYGHSVMFSGAKRNSYNLGRYHTYIHFHNLPTIPAGSEVVDAQFGVVLEGLYTSNCDSVTIGMYEVTGTKPAAYTDYNHWFQSMTWNTAKPSYDTTNVIDYVTVTSGMSTATWDMTELVKEWYVTGTVNTTAALAMVDEESMAASGSNFYYGNIGFYAYNSSYYPVFTVSYRNTTGIEPYYTYATLDGGNAGAAYISDYTGQLKVIKEVASYASSVNPFSLNLVYNSDYFSASNGVYYPTVDLGLSMNAGAGWTLDAIQRVVPETLNGQSYIRYHDGDGTIHYFFLANDGIYYDEDGLNLKMSKLNSTTYEMFDDKGTKWTFVNSYLTYARDENGNQFEYGYANGKLEYINQINNSSSAITMADLQYTGDKLTSIVDATGTTTTLIYSGEYLIGISRNNTRLATYSYSTGYQMAYMIDAPSSYKLSFEYLRGKISFYYESVNDTRGAEFTVTYPNYSQTVYRDHGLDGTANNGDDILTYYLFDDAGRTVNAYTTDNAGTLLGATNAVYTSGGTNQRKNNRLSRTSTIGVASPQMLNDFDFEDGASTVYWGLGGVGTATTNIVIKTDNPRTGSYSLKGWISDTAASTATVSASQSAQKLYVGKTYTLSAYVNTTGITNFAGDGIYLVAADPSGNTFKSNFLKYKTLENVENGWTRISLTFTPKTSSVHTIGIFNKGAQGIFYADDFQLEQGEAPSSLNLVTNGTMSVTGGWEGLNGTSYTTTAGRTSANTQVMKVVGDPEDGNTKFFQDIPINRPGKETYVLSGWVKANAVPDNVQTASDAAMDAYKQCGLRAVVYYSDGTNEFHYVPFNPDLSGWQYTSMSIVPTKPNLTISKIRVTCTYERNANTAYFDDIALVQEVVKTMDYDDNGNLKTSGSTGVPTEVSTYDGNNNLLTLVTGGKGNYTYTYAGGSYPHRLTTATLDGVLKQTYGYDAVGNVTSATLTPANGTSISLTTTASYTNNGNLLSSATDVNGITTQYGYADNFSKTFGIPTTIKVGRNAATTQTVDSFGRITNSSVANLNTIAYTYNTKFQLDKINRSASGITQTYDLNYDTFGNLASVYVGSQKLAGYTYKTRNGPLSKLTYGNGDTVSYAYDNLGRTKTVTLDNGTKLTYAYTGEGRLHSITETKGSSTIVYLYIYDSIGRLISSQKIEGGNTTLLTHQEYNTNNQLAKQSWAAGSTSHSETYAYNAADGTLNKITYNGSLTHSLSYDTLRRVSKRITANSGKTILTNNLTYHSGTTQVSSYNLSASNFNQLITYRYDTQGNITSVGDGVVETTYVYDDQNQLIRENNHAAKATWVWKYDNVGNILAREEYAYTTGALGTPENTVEYNYSTSGWKDLLTSYDGDAITYDASGNPLTFGPWTYTWQNGRQLASLEGKKDIDDTHTNDVAVSYTLDASGLRTGKSVSTTTHNYTKTVVAATCVEGGYTEYMCSCGDSYQTNILPALGHSFPSSTSPCLRCGYTQDHTHSFTTTVIAPTCTQKGYTRYTCGCGYTYESNYTAAKGHFYPTATSTVCTRCGYIRTLPASVDDSVSTFASSAHAYTREEYSYTYAGDKLIKMVVQSIKSGGTTTDTLTFSYDANGTPLTVTYNGTVYYYATNLQGDVIAILNSSGSPVVEYTYDAWGRILSATSSTLGNLNPLRYRGYVYDRETGMYYLQSRYYNPEMGRFISADEYASTGQGVLGYNMYAYCGNNPVSREDPSGDAFETVLDIMSLGASIAEVASNPSDPWAWAGLVGDLVDVAVPFVAGVGESVKAVSLAAKAADAVDDAYDASKAVDMLGGICFVAGTSVCTSNGFEAIENIKTDDYVWAWDETSGDVALKRVVETYVNEANELVHVFVNGEEIISTPEHPFYSPVKGWTEAVQLRAGDILVLVNGDYVVVEKVQHEILEAPVIVYNFQVEDYHTYYVTNAGVLVHNTCSIGSQTYVGISTGRTAPRNLVEKLAMDSAKSNPQAGREIIKSLKDMRFPTDYSKFQQTFNTTKGRIVIHYVGNRARNVFEDFKFTT